MVVLALAGGLFWSGCAGTSAPQKMATVEGRDREQESLLRAGDPLQIRIETTAMTAPMLYEVAVDDEGQIALPLIGKLMARDMTTSQLADKIQQAYVPRFYVRCTATVLAPVRFFYVNGEVKNPNRFQWSKDMTLLKAITTASGFTDFANRGAVEITRGRSKQVYNCEELRKSPEKDIPIQPGDSVNVLRSVW